MKALSLIRSFDFLGNSINFTINSNNKFSTILVGLISLRLYFMYIFLFYNFGKDLYFKEDPNGYTQIKPFINGTLPELVIDNNTFLIGIHIIDNVSQVIDPEKIFFPFFTYHNYTYNQAKNEFD